MKKIVFIMVVASFMSCNKDAKKILNQLPQDLGETENATQEVSEGQKVAAKLSKTTPLVDVELKNAFPQELKDLNIDEEPFVLGQQVMGSFGNHKMSLSIADAAGDKNQLAANFIDSYAFNKLPEQTDTFKVINKERNGIKTHAEYYKKSGKSEIWFLYNNRFYISLSNDDNRIKMTPDELWEAFDINELKNL